MTPELHRSAKQLIEQTLSGGEVTTELTPTLAEYLTTLIKQKFGTDSVQEAIDIQQIGGD